MIHFSDVIFNNMCGNANPLDYNHMTVSRLDCMLLRIESWALGASRSNITYNRSTDSFVMFL